MSYEMAGQDVVFAQRILRSEGLFKGEVSGDWTSQTDKAAKKFYEAARLLRDELGEFDQRTESNIFTLKLRAQMEARKFMSRLINAELNAVIISGTRTYAQQNSLFRKGRWGNKDRKITYARGGESAHNFGLAWDIGIFSRSGKYSKEKRDYEKAAVYGKSDSLHWGGDWKKFRDLPHYQLKTDFKSIAEAREMFEVGKVFLV
jgi:peptidoglycan L-alanyl-D-glutamate endopeptidase CwlK